MGGAKWKKGLNTIACTPQKGEGEGGSGRTWSPAQTSPANFGGLFGVPDSPLHRLVNAKFGEFRDDGLIGGFVIYRLMFDGLTFDV